LDQGSDTPHLAPVHTCPARRRDRSTRQRAGIAVVSAGAAGVAPAAFRRLRRPAAEDHLGAARSCKHRGARERRLSLAWQAPAGARGRATCARADACGDVGDGFMTRPRLTTGEIFRWPLCLGALTAIGLASALFGDGGWDTLSWVAMAVPLAVLGWK